MCYERTMLTSRRKEPSEDNKPVQGLVADQKPEIPRKPKKETPVAVPAENGTSEQNGKHAPEASESSTLKRPRPDDSDDLIEVKKAKVMTTSSSDDVVIVDDSTGGAIVIDDD